MVTEAIAVPAPLQRKKSWRVFLVIIAVAYIGACIVALAAGFIQSCQDEIVNGDVRSICRPIALTDPLGMMAGILFIVSVLVIVGYNVATISVGGDKWAEVKFHSSEPPNESGAKRQLGPEVDTKGLDSILSNQVIHSLRLILLGAAASHVDSLVYAFYIFNGDRAGYCWASTLRSPSAPRTYGGMVGSRVLLDLARAKESENGTSTEWVNYNPEAIDNVRPCFFAPVITAGGRRMGVLAILPTVADGEIALLDTAQSLCAQLERSAGAVAHALTASASERESEA